MPQILPPKLTILWVLFRALFKALGKTRSLQLDQFALGLASVTVFALAALRSDQPTIPKVRCAPRQEEASLNLTLIGQASNPPGSQ